MIGTHLENSGKLVGEKISDIYSVGTSEQLREIRILTESGRIFSVGLYDTLEYK